MASVIRLASRRVATPSLARSFSISASVKKDLVQDLYVSQLKNYKPAPTTKDAHNGHVRNYTAPTPPKAPVLPTDLAGELSKFDSEEPTFTAAAPKAAAPTEGGEGADEFLAFLEKDKPSADAHH